MPSRGTQSCTDQHCNQQPRGLELESGQLSLLGANDSLQDCIIKLKLHHYEAIWENKSKFITEETHWGCCTSLLSGRCPEAQPVPRSQGHERLFPWWQELRSTPNVGWQDSPVIAPTAAFYLSPASHFPQDICYRNNQPSGRQRHGNHKICTHAILGQSLNLCQQYSKVTKGWLQGAG